jgi:taurine dioxygenase
MGTLEVDRLAGSCGAVVRGLDLSVSQSPAQIEAVKLLLDEHLVVAFADQRFDLDRLEAFTDELGGRDVTPYVRPVADRPFVIRVIKEPTDELNFANAWHTDLSYLTAPPAYTVLHAYETPPAGGDTMWANQCLAYETLPDDVKARIDGLVGTHSAGLAYGTGGYLESVAEKSSMGIEPSADAYATETHPLVVRHPRTGRPALYANSVYTTGIEGMDDAEARPLLARLVAHATHPNLTCRLRWEPHMLTIWDNVATQHFAINDYPGARREMFRTSVRGTSLQPA